MASRITQDVFLEDVSPCYNQYTLPLLWQQPQTTSPRRWLRVVVKEGNISLILHDGRPPYHLDAQMPGIIGPEEVFHLQPVGDCRFYVEYYHQSILHQPPHLSRGSFQSE